MTQFIIAATSAKTNATETNTAQPVLQNPAEEGMVKVAAPVIPFPSPAEFEDQAAADAQAAKYATWLNLNDIGGTDDWVGTATAD